MSYYHWPKNTCLPTHRAYKFEGKCVSFLSYFECNLDISEGIRCRYIFVTSLDVVNLCYCMHECLSLSFKDKFATRMTVITSHVHGRLLCIYSTLLLQNRSLLFFFTPPVCTSEICETLKMFCKKICFKRLFMSRIIKYARWPTAKSSRYPVGIANLSTLLPRKKKKFLIQRTRMKIKGWSQRVKFEKFIIKLESDSF